MAQAYGPVLTFLIFLWILSLTEAKEVNVTCIFHEDCVLPCSFRPPGAVVIHWYKQQVPVHSYYYNKDQFGLQNKHFSGRTCLFNSQISTNGNASLHLRRVKVQDKGRYKCYTSTRKGNHESFVNLEVKALIQSVHIEMTDKMITCSSHNIYPVPQVAWATDPPSALDALQNFTTVKSPDIRGLFTVKSMLRMLGNSSDHAYFCSFVSADKAQVWTASRKNQEDMTEEEGRAFSIPCIAPRNLHNFSLTWTFTGSSEPAVVTTVIRYDSRTRLTFNLWDGEADLEDQDAVQAGNGSLLLQHPESQEHTGTYICTFSGLQSRHMVQTKVNVTVAPVSVTDERVERSWWSTAASVTFFMFTIFVVLSQCLRFRAPGTRGLSHRHNGTGLNDGGHHEHLNPTVSYVTRPYAVVKDAIPQPEPHLQGELEGDIPKIEGNYSVGPQPNSTYMEHAEESAGPPMAGNCSLHTESEESGEVRHHMPCAQDLDLMGLASTLEGDMVEQQTEDDGTRTDLLSQQDAQT